jgi:uncharacterized protein YecE (DUF72 family)
VKWVTGATIRRTSARTPAGRDGVLGLLRLRREHYGDADLAAWAGRIGSQGWSEAYVFFKHEDDGTAPLLAGRLLSLTSC